MTILVCSPHPDDEVIGMGGTIAQYASEGERVVLLIFSLGERTSLQKQEAIRARRQRESKKAAELLGVSEVIFLKLPDLKLKHILKKKEWEQEFHRLLDKEQPRAIFTTALDDGHLDHRAVTRFVNKSAHTYKFSGTIWMYTVWNPLAFLYRDQPQLIVDISNTFSKQWSALHLFESQKIGVYRLLPIIFLRRVIHGLRHKCRFAEVFLQAPKYKKPKSSKK
jgi:LmbE family N-acetylglucosaminyl deacetylase